MIGNGYSAPLRQFSSNWRVRQLRIPESHPPPLRLIAYASAWLKCWHPDIFAPALLNAQPMGFYARPRSSAMRRARREIRPVCRQCFALDWTLDRAR